MEPFSSDQKTQLLKHARATLQAHFQTYDGPAIPRSPDPVFQQKCGGFVTLRIHGQLRGCIGEIEPTRDAWSVVTHRVIDAAIRDPRFPPLEEEEIHLVHIEISLLTPPQQIASHQEIEIGRHGIVMEKNGRSAVFLPQVAPEQGWDLPTTLSHLARKAGLTENAWQTGASFEVFEAIIMEEKPAMG